MREIDRLNNRMGTIAWAMYALLARLEWSGTSTEIYCGNENTSPVCPICGARAPTPLCESGKHTETCELKTLINALEN